MYIEPVSFALQPTRGLIMDDIGGQDFFKRIRARTAAQTVGKGMRPKLGGGRVASRADGRD
jgi:hypothetical protein